MNSSYGFLDQTQFENLLKEAEIYFQQGLYEEAKDNYKKLLDLLNEMPPSKELIPQRRFLEEKILEIERLSKETISTKKDNLSLEDIYKNALGLKELGLFKEAISYFKNLIELSIKNKKEDFFKTSLENLIECHKRENRLTDCIAYLNNLVLNNLDKELLDLIYYKIGLLYKDLGIYRNSLTYFNKIRNKNLFVNLKREIRLIEDRAKKATRFDYLLKQNFITTKELKEAFKIAKKENKSVEYILIKRFNVPKNEVGNSLSFYYGCEFYSFSPNIEVPQNLIKGLKKEFLKHNLWIPLKEEHGKTIVLVDDPYDINRTDIIKKFFKNVKIGIAIREDILEFINYFWEHLNKSTESVKDLLIEFQDNILQEEAYAPEEDIILSESRIARFVHDMILEAWRKNASDIHIEPCSLTYKTDIRFRIDGVCQHYATIPNSVAREVISRIKIMANLDIAEKRLPQDGKIKFMKDGKLLLELRVATLPSVGGLEDVVLRLLSTGTPIDLEKLGMSQNVLEKFKDIIKKPYGLILVVGPTGSGKTTTLHSALKCINTPEIKIWTAEDPVEITQKGLRQIEVNPQIGLTFAKIMRAFLRADPDVIMIGEMRDKETASIAIEASLTGHLVFSTLHTNTAPETITRLLDMGLDPFNFADSLLGVLSQRLIRKLCNHCKEEYHPTEDEFNEIAEEFGKDLFEKTVNIKYTSDLKLYRPKGCEFCGNTGYKGRIGIYEFLINSENIKKLIKKRAPTEEIRKVAISEGMMTLKQDGILKVLQGISDLKEVKRVCIE